MGVAWKSVRFGLILNGIGARVIAIVFLLNAAITLALLPWVVGREFNPVIGFFCAVALAAVYLGMVRRALILESEETATQIGFVVVSVLVCQLVYAHPATLQHVLLVSTELTPAVFAGSLALFVAGSVFCVLCWSGLRDLVLALLSLATMLVTGAVLLKLVSLAENVRWIQAAIPHRLLAAELFEIPLFSIIGLIASATCAVVLHGLFLRGVAGTYRDETTQKYVSRYLIYQLVASGAIAVAFYLIRDYRPRQVLAIGNASFDTLTICFNSIVSLLAAVAATWLGRAIRGVSGLIDPFRLAEAR